MSVVVDRRNLTRYDEETIVKMLTIQPVETHPFRGKFRNNRGNQAKPSFAFYSVEGNYVRLPMAFAYVFFKERYGHVGSSQSPNSFAKDGEQNPSRIFGNDQRNFHRLHLEFKGELRPRQKKRVAKLDPLFAKHRTATFCGHTAFGKTKVSLYYIAKHGLFTLVLVPGTQLMDQWPKAIKEVFPQARVGVVGENFRDDGWYDEERVFHCHQDLPDILVCMPGRWQTIPDEVRDRVGFVIVDEGHMFCCPTRSVCLLQFSPKYTMVLTASPQRRDGTLGVIHSLVGLHQVRARYPNLVTVWKFELKMTFPTVKNVRGETNWQGTVKQIVENDEYNQLIVDLTYSLVREMGRKPLLMCERKYHVNTLVEEIRRVGISCDYMMEDKSNYQDSESLIAITTKAGTGFDEQYACPDIGGDRIDTVIYCTSIKELNRLIQYGGRAFRADDPLIIHLVVDNNIVQSHWRAADKYYRSGDYLKRVEIKTIAPEDLWGDDQDEEQPYDQDDEQDQQENRRQDEKEKDLPKPVIIRRAKQ